MTSRTSIRRAGLGLVTTVALVGAVSAGASSPASGAATTSTVQRTATAEWLKLGTIPEAAGNVHVGRVQAWLTPGLHTVDSVYGETLDYTCPDGYAPTGLWLDAIPQLDANCTLEDNLIMESGDLVLSVQGDLHQGRLVGDLDYIHGYAVGDPGSFAVDLRWDAPGGKDVVREKIGSRPAVFLVTTTRDASVNGTIGTATVGPVDQTSAGVLQRVKTVRRG